MKKKVIQKSLMITIKFLVGLTPLLLKVKLRKISWLHALYGSSLRNSGLFYGRPSEKKLHSLYQSLLVKQECELRQKISTQSQRFEVNYAVVMTENEAAFTKTLESIRSTDSACAVYLIIPNNVSFESGLVELLSGSGIVLLDSNAVEGMNVPLFLVNAGDEIDPYTISILCGEISNRQNEGIVYSDTDRLTSKGVRSQAELYPDWNPDLQLSTGYIKTGVLLNGRILLNHFLTFLKRCDSPRVISLWMIDVYLSFPKIEVLHVPYSLVHQAKCFPQDWDKQLKQYKTSAYTLNASQAPGVAYLKWPDTSLPLVSIVIPTRNAKTLVKTCIDSILAKTTYANYEIIIVDNNSDDPEAIEYFNALEHKHRCIRVIKYPYDFNYSAINNFAVSQATGDVIALINNDIEVISQDWLTDMVCHVSREDIGCVGAKLLYPDKRIQHAGVVMGYGGGAGHAHKFFPHDHAGYLNRLSSTNNFSAITAACLLVKKEDYVAAGGLNESDLTVAFNDVDFSLKILETGKRNLYCAEAVLYHHESVSRGLDNTTERRLRFESELQYLRRHWKHIIDEDPSYNKNLTLKFENFSIKGPNEY